jgi:aminoglycoside phosphotransferase (APT) family kinase protein
MARLPFCGRDNTGILLPVTPRRRHKSSMQTLALSPADAEELAAALTRMGLLAAGGNFTAASLTGGVSCDVWLVERPDLPRLVVKRALARLRVAADWRAPPERWATEVAWLKLAGGIDPSTAPQILGEDRQAKMFAMAFLENLPLWKSELAAGRVDTGFAAVTGHKLATIHALTAGREDIARSFAHDDQFFALRLEPYLLFTAARNPDVAKTIEDIAQAIAVARIALMQGDISPKNILMGEEGPVFLDAETACYGDPVFDLAFCLNHLLLKCVWHPQFADAYLASFRALADAYLARVDWEDQNGLEARTAKLLAALLLARVDGKSPVEYLTADADKSFVRETAKIFLKNSESSLDAMADIWGRSPQTLHGRT